MLKSGMPTPDPLDRRPIASRNIPAFQRLAHAFARAGLSPNAISVAGMLAAIAAAAALLATNSQEGAIRRALFLAAAAGIQLRLLANMLDGMVALASRTASPTGELFNEIPDRISDTLLLAAAGYAAGGLPALGWLAACLALFVTYIRAVGKTLGIPGLFHGPMSKSHRMFTLTLACIYLAAAPDSWQPSWPYWQGASPPPTPPPTPPTGHSPGLIAATLLLIILGSVVTAARRLRKILRHLKS
jgi:phosphatidylglycerophosphate synthase